MHKVLDQIFLLDVQKTIEMQHIPKDEQEEQKELDLKKQFLNFMREAEALLM